MANRLVKKMTIGVVALLTVLKAEASPELSGLISELWVNDQIRSNVVFISVGTAFQSTCGANSGYLIIDLTTPAMKEAYAMALSASISGRAVKMGGGGACYQTYEKLQYIYLTL